MGTRVRGLQVTKVTDGDTIKVDLMGTTESLRLTCADTEESLPGSSKPVTRAGLMASEMAKAYFSNEDGSLVKVDIEFDSNEPLDACLQKQRDNYGRLLCYVHKGDDNYSLRLVREGWSPYFDKYGRSRVYHDEMTRAEALAQAEGRVIWNPTIQNRGDYQALKAWWSMRALAVEDYRRVGLDAGVLSVRVDYATLLAAAAKEQEATILADLQGGVNLWTGEGALIYAGSVYHKFNLWIPDAASERGQQIMNLIQTRYAGTGRGYVYVSGALKLYKERPEIVIRDIRQLSDFPPA